MSVAKREGSPFYYYRFVLAGRRFRGSTETTNRRDAEAVEKAARAAAKAQAAELRAREAAPVTFKMAADRYWTEVGQHHKRSDQTRAALEWLIDGLGAAKALGEVCDSDVARLVARRRGDLVVNVARDGAPSKRRRRTPPGTKRVSPARVNRSVTEPLRKVMLRARKAWGLAVREINWREHLLKEPRERVRALSGDEERRLFAALPAQFRPIVTFCLRMGVRESEACGLTWGRVDWGERNLRILGKGGKEATIPMPDDVRDLLWSLQAKGTLRVFRYTNGNPITVPGLVSAFRRARAAAEVEDFRVHDLRHTAATRLLKDTGNIKMVAKLLRHEDIATTAKYAHVFDDDLRAAMNRQAAEARREGGHDGQRDGLHGPTEAAKSAL